MFSYKISNKYKHFYAKLFLSSRERERIYSKIAVFLKSNLPLPDALNTLLCHYTDNGKTPHHPIAIAINNWDEELKNGKKFSDSLKGWIPEEDLSIIEAGEMGGNLVLALENVIFTNKGKNKIISSIIKGASYPLLLLLSSLVFLILFGLKIVPAFEQVLPRDKWTGAPMYLANISEIFVDHALIALLSLVMLLILVAFSLPNWTGKYRVYFDKIPPWSIYRLIIGTGFLLSLGSMLKVGITDDKALQTLRNNAKKYYFNILTETLGFLRNGDNLGEALYRTGKQFPDKETVIDFRSYAKLPDFENILKNSGIEWMNSSEEKTKSIMSVFQILSFLVMGTVITSFGFSIFSLQSQVTAAL